MYVSGILSCKDATENVIEMRIFALLKFSLCIFAWIYHF